MFTNEGSSTIAGFPSTISPLTGVYTSEAAFTLSTTAASPPLVSAFPTSGISAEIPDVGKALTSGGEAAVVESVKAASDVYTPVSGEIVEGNPAIVEDPSLVNKDPEGNGWFFKIKITSPDELTALMSKADYDKFVEENPS